jgi:hypothetical protein
MTLLDAPKFDEVRERRNQKLIFGGVGAMILLVVGFWLVSGRPVDWPWNWYSHLCGRVTVNHFFAEVEKNDLQSAYGIWVHDKNWQQHSKAHTYTFERFQQDWSPESPDNEYGAIKSHRIAATHIHGNVLMVGIFVNERKSKAINLDYDPKTHELNFSPDFVQFFEGAGGIS